MKPKQKEQLTALVLVVVILEIVFAYLEMVVFVFYNAFLLIFGLLFIFTYINRKNL